MRKGQRFTPKRLQKWIEQGRGTGAGEAYQPWHQVTRSDPGSRGRSHLINSKLGRLHHFLSDLELMAYSFATMLPDVADLQEQFPLALDSEAAEFSHASLGAGVQPGTKEIAKALGLVHPTLRKDGAAQPWIMTTDLVLTLEQADRDRSRLAVSIKPVEGLAGQRQRELLAIEREYWLRRSVPWLLVTPEQYDPMVAWAIRAGAIWALGTPAVELHALETCAKFVATRRRPTLGETMRQLPGVLGVTQVEAQSAFWQAVWCGKLPLDLGTAIRPASTLRLLEHDAFWDQNPIAARRSAWNA